MSVYSVPVFTTTTTDVKIEASSVEEAIEKARDQVGFGDQERNITLGEPEEERVEV